MNNSLIFGKDNTEKVIGIEDNTDGTTTVLTQADDGSIESETRISDYWIMTTEPVDAMSIELAGTNPLKYKNIFTTLEDWQYAKKSCYRTKYTKENSFIVHDAREMFMLQSGVTMFKGMKHSDVSILSFDLETTSLDVKQSDAKILLIANTFRDFKGNVTRRLFCYDDYKNQGEMLTAWAEFVRETNPTIILGHNIFNFDLPYLEGIAKKNKVELLLGSNGSAIKFNSYESKFRKDGSQEYSYHKANIYGRQIVDTFFLSIKYDIGRKYPSYGLKHIIDFEKLQVQDRQFYDASQIRFTYQDPTEWVKIKKYAEHDADDAIALYDLMGPSFFYMCQSIPKTYQEVGTSATGSQLNSIMCRAYLQEDHGLPKASQAEYFQGAISLGNPGLYKNALKVDVKSLYPSIMLQYEIYDNVKDPSGYFKQIVKYFTEQRLTNKTLAKQTGEKYFDDLQSSQKIFINSAYGFLGAPGLLFNSFRNAEFITNKGREILTTSIDWSMKRNFTLINADTDSISFCNPDGTAFSDQEQQDLLNELNSLFPEKIKFDHDGYFETALVLAAKNYVLRDHDGEITIKGSALRSSKTEPALTEFQYAIIDLLLTKRHGLTYLTESQLVEFKAIYIKYINEVLNVTDIKRWASKKTITDKVMNNERANEAKVREAIKDTEYKEADKIFCFYKNDDSLCLVEHFNGDYNKKRLLERLYKSSKIFDKVLDTKSLFPNYSLKRNQSKLADVQ